LSVIIVIGCLGLIIKGFGKPVVSNPQLAVTSASPKISSREAMFYAGLKNNAVQCKLCFRRCIIEEAKTGFCRTRKNQQGKLYSLVYGLPSAIHIDPIEKEPCFHMLPGSKILCFGTAGCNFKCRHCHNWHLSQSAPGDIEVTPMEPASAVDLAVKHKIPALSFTYNEPTVFYEYVYDISRLAKGKGLKILWHSNGALNAEPLRELLKYTDAVTIDLKGFTSRAYQNSQAELEPVLNTLKIIKEEGVWLEIVNLVIPAINDSPEDIRRMCEWIKENLGADTPLHFSRFFPNYKLTHLPPTPPQTLDEAYKIAKEAGLNFVTLGNLPGHKYNSTLCPDCGKILIRRTHFQVLSNNIEKGRCRFCGRKIPGIWQ